MILSDFITFIGGYCKEKAIDVSKIEQFNNAAETIYTYYKKEYECSYKERMNLCTQDFETTQEYEEFFYQ